MRMPAWERFIHMSQGFALILCGMILGAAVFMSITHQQLNTEIMKNRSLEADMKKLLEDNESLNIYRNRQTVIKSVSVGVENNPQDKELDQVIVSEIRRRVEADLKNLKGRPISYIDQDPNQVKNIYGARVLPNIHDKDYIVEIHTLIVIYGELKIWVSAREYIRQPT